MGSYTIWFTASCLTFKDDKLVFGFKNSIVKNHPYITLSTTEHVVKDHNDIWNKRVVGLVESLIQKKVTAEVAYRLPASTDEVEEFEYYECPTTQGYKGTLDLPANQESNTYLPPQT